LFLLPCARLSCPRQCFNARKYIVSYVISDASLSIGTDCQAITSLVALSATDNQLNSQEPNTKSTEVHNKK